MTTSRLVVLQGACVLALLSVAAAVGTYQSEIATASAAISQAPGYTLSGQYTPQLSQLLRLYGAKQKNPRVTVFAPSDTAIMPLVTTLSPNSADLTALVNMHVVKENMHISYLKSLPKGTRLSTLNPAVKVVKFSARNRVPIQVATTKSPVPVTVVKTIFQGNYITVLAIDTAFHA